MKINIDRKLDYPIFGGYDNNRVCIGHNYRVFALEDFFLSRPRLSVIYVSRLGTELNKYPALRKKLELTISKDAEHVLQYCINYDRGGGIKQRLPIGEPAILEDSGCLYRYLIHVVCGPWPEAEDSLSSEAKTSYNYCARFLKKPWDNPEREHVVLKHPHYSKLYLDFKKKHERENN